MPVLQVVSNKPRAGKTLLIAALLTQLAQRGQRVGYFKPFSAAGANDPDLAFIAQRLQPGVVAAAPLSATPDSGGAAAASRLEAAVVELLEQTDWLLVEGPNYPLIAPLADAATILVFGYSEGLTAAAVAACAAPYGGALKGVMVNGVTRYRLREVKENLLPALARQGVPALGAIPEDRELLAVTVGQIAERLGCAWVEEPVDPEITVGRFLIGANILDNGPVYLGRFADQAVIVRAGRPDIQMAALRTDTRCLILTGGHPPIEYVRVEARKNDIPMLMVDGDTRQVAEALGGLLEQSNPYTGAKVARFSQLLRENVGEAVLPQVAAV